MAELETLLDHELIRICAESPGTPQESAAKSELKHARGLKDDDIEHEIDLYLERRHRASMDVDKFGRLVEGNPYV